MYSIPGTNITGIETARSWQWPGFSEGAAKWLLANHPNFNGVAVDSVSCDNGPMSGDPVNTCPVHVQLLGAGKALLFL